MDNLNNKLSDEAQSQPSCLGAVSRSYLILSGEGNIDTKHQFCMECKTLEEANKYFDNFKRGEFAETYLYIYEAVKVREA
jgi:hypothetical protein